MPGSAAAADAFNKAIDLLIDGQRIVVTDIGAYALAYHEYGASALAKYAPDPSMRLAFSLQAQADDFALQGDFVNAADQGRKAAKEMGIFEQQRLQPMWDGLKGLSQVTDKFWMLETDIATVLGVIKTPNNLPGEGPWDLSYRIGILHNAFDFMHDKVFSPVPFNYRNKVEVQDYFNKVWKDGGVKWKSQVTLPLWEIN